MRIELNKKARKGELIVLDLLAGRITDFKEFVDSTTDEYQSMLTRSKSVGRFVAEYVKKLEQTEEKTKIVDTIFATKSFEFIEIFRVAKDISTKFDKYESDVARRRSYLARHPGITDYVFNYAYELAKCSSMSKKAELIDKSISYGEVQQEFIIA